MGARADGVVSTLRNLSSDTGKITLFKIAAKLPSLATNILEMRRHHRDRLNLGRVGESLLTRFFVGIPPFGPHGGFRGRVR